MLLAAFVRHATRNVRRIKEGFQFCGETGAFHFGNIQDMHVEYSRHYETLNFCNILQICHLEYFKLSDKLFQRIIPGELSICVEVRI